MGQDITADHIAQFLESRDDFDLELFANRELKEHHWRALHGGTYIDPFTNKPRQFDLQAWSRFPLHCEIFLAVECKSLSTENPLVVSRVPREAIDSYHNILRKTYRPAQGDSSTSVDKIDAGIMLYPEQKQVGKSTTQIRWNDNSKKLVSSDSETYDKWSQALSSAADLLATYAKKPHSSVEPTFVFVLPVLIVSDQSLWVVDYSDSGTRRAPEQVDEATLFVDREVLIDGVYTKHSFRMSHLNIYTRTGFVDMLDNLANPSGLMFEKIFGTAIRRANKSG